MCARIAPSLEEAPTTFGTMREEVTKVRIRLNSKVSYSLEPHSRRMRQWDGVTFAALIFTAIVTPVEVAFTNNGEMMQEPTIFLVNRFVDVIFFTDIVLQFFVAYHDEHLGGILVKSRRMIAKRYLKGWFFLDSVSLIPFDLMHESIHDGEGSLKVLKVLRLLRLLKLFRVIRASRILKRWEEAAIFTFSYAEISMNKFFCKLLLYAHWNACVWGMVAHKEVAGGYTWMSAFTEKMTERRGVYKCAFDDDQSDAQRRDFWSVPASRESANKFELPCEELTNVHFDKRRVMHKYWASLYFAVYTMTGIGYGDITATGHTEVVVATLIMLSGAVFWAYMIGEFVTLVSHIDVYGNAFRQKMDELNYMMKEKKYPVKLRRRCRMYLLHCRNHQRQTNYRELEKSMSISLRHEVAVTNNQWIARVWYFSRVGASFVADLSQHSRSLVYAPTEVVEETLTLCVINSGIAARKGRVLSKWAVWGHDFLLDNIDLVDVAFAAALSYLEIVGISREQMIKILENPFYSRERCLVRKAVVFYTIKAHCIRIGANQLNKGRRRRSCDDSLRLPAVESSADDQSRQFEERQQLATAVGAARLRRTSISLVTDPTAMIANLPRNRSFTRLAPLRDSRDSRDSIPLRDSRDVFPYDEDGDRVVSRLRVLEDKITKYQDRATRAEDRLSSQINDLNDNIQRLLDLKTSPVADKGGESSGKSELDGTSSNGSFHSLASGIFRGSSRKKIYHTSFKE